MWLAAALFLRSISALFLRLHLRLQRRELIVVVVELGHVLALLHEELQLLQRFHRQAAC